MCVFFKCCFYVDDRNSWVVAPTLRKGLEWGYRDVSSVVCVGGVWRRSTLGAGHATGSAGHRTWQRRRLRTVSSIWTSRVTGPAATVKVPHDTGGGSIGLQQVLSRPPPGTNTFVPTEGSAIKVSRLFALNTNKHVLVVLNKVFCWKRKRTVRTYVYLNKFNLSQVWRFCSEVSSTHTHIQAHTHKTPFHLPTCFVPVWCQSLYFALPINYLSTLWLCTYPSIFRTHLTVKARPLVSLNEHIPDYSSLLTLLKWEN